MAKGVTKSTTFKKGDPRAVAAGQKSSRALPPDLKDARQMNANLFEDTVYKHMDKSVEEIEVLLKDKTISARDMVVIRILALAIQHGDTARLNFLLERTIGKVIDKIQMDSNVKTMNLHALIMKEIEDGNK